MTTELRLQVIRHAETLAAEPQDIMAYTLAKKLVKEATEAGENPSSDSIMNYVRRLTLEMMMVANNIGIATHNKGK